MVNEHRLQARIEVDNDIIVIEIRGRIVRSGPFVLAVLFIIRDRPANTSAQSCLTLGGTGG